MSVGVIAVYTESSQRAGDVSQVVVASFNCVSGSFV